MVIYFLHWHIKAVDSNFVCLIFQKCLLRSKYKICWPLPPTALWLKGLFHTQRKISQKRWNFQVFKLSSSSWHTFCQMYLQISPGFWWVHQDQVCPNYTQQHPKQATPPGMGLWGTDITLRLFHCSQAGTDFPWLTALLQFSYRNPCCSRHEAVIWCKTFASGHIVHLPNSSFLEVLLDHWMVLA